MAMACIQAANHRARNREMPAVPGNIAVEPHTERIANPRRNGFDEPMTM